jgi:hypothetical protein
MAMSAPDRASRVSGTPGGGTRSAARSRHPFSCSARCSTCPIHRPWSPCTRRPGAHISAEPQPWQTPQRAHLTPAIARWEWRRVPAGPTISRRHCGPPDGTKRAWPPSVRPHAARVSQGRAWARLSGELQKRGAFALLACRADGSGAAARDSAAGAPAGVS